MINCLLAAFAGYTSHFIRPMLKRRFTGSYLWLMCYAVGSLQLFAVQYFFMMWEGATKRELWRFTYTFATSALAFGGGVFAGHLHTPER